MKNTISLTLRNELRYKLDEFKRASLLEKAGLIVIYAAVIVSYVLIFLFVTYFFIFAYRFLSLVVGSFFN
jgi:hypothetical protein